MRRVGRWLAVAAMLGLGSAGAAHAASSIVLPRAGQVGVAFVGQFGSFLESGGLGDEFGSGPGFGVRVRYRMRYERGIGLSFENQRMEARDPSSAETAFSALEDSARRERLHMVTAGVDFFQFFDTRSRTVKQVNVGLGLAQPSARLSTTEIQYPIIGDGFYLSAGAGVERFFFRSWAYDIGARYMAVFHDGKVNHDLQGSIGVILYMAY